MLLLWGGGRGGEKRGKEKEREGAIQFLNVP